MSSFKRDKKEEEEGKKKKVGVKNNNLGSTFPSEDCWVGWDRFWESVVMMIVFVFGGDPRRRKQSLSEPGEDVRAAGDADVQRNSGQCSEMYPHFDQDSVSYQPGEWAEGLVICSVESAVGFSHIN